MEPSPGHIRCRKIPRCSESVVTQELSCDPSPQYFLKSIVVQMGGVLQYKWGVYCWVPPLLQGLEARKAQQYKWEAYCRTNWRCTAGLSARQVGVGVSETLLNCARFGQKDTQMLGKTTRKMSLSHAFFWCARAQMFSKN